MNIVLVTQHHSRSPQAVPLAAAFLASALTSDEDLAASCRITLCDLFPETSPDEALDSILSAAPDAVGISVYLWNRGRSLELARDLKERQHGLTLFVGGPEPTADPSPFLADGLCDFAVIGEGETTFVEAVAALRAGQAVAGIPGVATLAAGKIVLAKRHPTGLLDTLPSPLLAGILDLSLYTGMLWQLTRGCDFGCTFCCDTGSRRGIRRFSLGRVEAELLLLARNRVSQVFVLDPTFNRDTDRAKRILRMIRKHAPHIHFHFEIRNELLDREQAFLFAGITCSLQIGLQSAHPAVLARVGRGFSREDFSAKTALLNEAGATFGFDLIYGLPGDNLDGFRQSLDFALSLYPNHLDIFPLAVLPGSPLATGRECQDLKHHAAPPYTLIESPSFPAPEMAQAARLAEVCDLFYSRGKSVAWFNGVCRALKLPPSGILEEFAAWLHREEPGSTEADLEDTDIWKVQRRFLIEIFTSRQCQRLLPVALDLLDYHHHYAAALLAPAPELPTDRDLAAMDLAETCFVVAPSTRLARFNYEITDILEAGEVDLPKFVLCFRKTGSYAVIYPRGGDVLTESLNEHFFRLLELQDGRTPLRKTAAGPGVALQESLSFMEFAMAEGIVIQSGNGMVQDQTLNIRGVSGG